VPTLHIDLREGFSGEAVVIRIGDREIYNRRDVRTNYSVGLADRIAAEIAADQVLVEVELPDRGARQSVSHSASGSTTLAISLDPAGNLVASEVQADARYL
jgi:hypothetical protein